MVGRDDPRQHCLGRWKRLVFRSPTRKTMFWSSMSSASASFTIREVAVPLKGVTELLGRGGVGNYATQLWLLGLIVLQKKADISSCIKRKSVLFYLFTIDQFHFNHCNLTSLTAVYGTWTLSTRQTAYFEQG